MVMVDTWTTCDRNLTQTLFVLFYSLYEPVIPSHFYYSMIKKADGPIPIG